MVCYDIAMQTLPDDPLPPHLSAEAGMLCGASLLCFDRLCCAVLFLGMLSCHAELVLQFLLLYSVLQGLPPNAMECNAGCITQG